MRVQQIASTVATGAQLLAALTSAFILSVIIWSQMPASWPLWASYGLTGLMVGAVIAIIELFPRAMLPSTLDTLFQEGKNSYDWSFTFFTLIICFGLQGVSILTSYHSRELIAEAIVKKPQIINSAGFALAHDSLLQATRMRYESRIDKFETTEPKRISEAKKRKQELAASALASKGKEMKRLFETGNAWAAAQLRSSLSKADGKGEALIEGERVRVSRLKRERDSTLRAMELSSSQKVQFFEQSNHSKLEAYQHKTNRYKSYAAWIGIGGSVVFLIMTIFLALHRRVTGLKLQRKQEAPPLLHAIFGVFDNLFNGVSRGVYTLAEAEEMVNVSYGSRKQDQRLPGSVDTPPTRGVKGGWQITCRNCGQQALKQRKTAKYCSVECHDKWHSKQGTDVEGIKRMKARKTPHAVS